MTDINWNNDFYPMITMSCGRNFRNITKLNQGQSLSSSFRGSLYDLWL